MSVTTELSTILKVLMDSVNMSVTELARQTNIGQPVVHRMATGETDNPKVMSLSPIAKFFNINISQLIGDEPLPKDRFGGNYNPDYRSWSKLPLLSWEQAAQWPDRVTLNEIFSFISTESSVSTSAFAVKMEDNTMDPRYPEETLLVIDPEILCHNQDFALVHIEGQKKAQFKQVLFDGDDLYLKPLNPDFQVKRVEERHRILGVLVQSLTEYHQNHSQSGEDASSDTFKFVVKKRKDQATFETET